MLLAEAIIEKEYIEESISNLANVISESLIVYDKTGEKLNRERLKALFKKFEDLYTKYQRFNVMIGRAEALAAIPINEAEISLKDAMVIKEVMEGKLGWFTDFLNELGQRKPEKIICVDRDGLEEKIDILRADIKTLKFKIQNKIWNTEVK